jgi:hypothetical protein
MQSLIATHLSRVLKAANSPGAGLSALWYNEASIQSLALKIAVQAARPIQVVGSTKECRGIGLYSTLNIAVHSAHAMLEMEQDVMFNAPQNAIMHAMSAPNLSAALC